MQSRPARNLAVMFLLLLPFAAYAQSTAIADLPRVASNDNRGSAGRLADGVLDLRLDIRRASWCPEDPNGGHLNVFAFAEEDGPPQIPGPLVRVPQGTQ